MSRSLLYQRNQAEVASSRSASVARGALPLLDDQFKRIWSLPEVRHHGGWLPPCKHRTVKSRGRPKSLGCAVFTTSPQLRMVVVLSNDT